MKSNKQKKLEKDIYSLQEYKEIFNYAINIDFHKNRAINDGLKIITNSDNVTHYASSWLYVMVHLNNAWRHQDICRFPTINLIDLDIFSLEQFRDIVLSKDQAHQIINQIISKNLVVSKTNVTNQFFCSEDTIIPLANALVICQLINDNTQLNNKNLIDFGNKNQKFSSKAQKAFFADFHDKSFAFENRKFNRTLLTFIHSLLVQSGHGGAALEVAKRLRAHKDIETTNIYITIPENEFNNLCLQLFSRSHFGYIPSLFSNFLTNKPITTYTQNTKNIIEINKIMGGIYGIEATSGFINSMLAEKKTIMDMVLNMGKEEAFNFLFKIDCNLLPSKETNFQCLLSESGCIKPFLSCKTCSYSIPNFYALSAIADSVTLLLNNLSNSFSNTTLEAEKRKLANLLYREIELLSQACLQFGQEEVFRFFKGNKEGFLRLLEKVDEINQQNELESYLSFQPI